MEEEIVKMSAKGQLVVPNVIRKSQKLSPRDRFIALPVGKGVLFKKVEITSVKNQLNSLFKDMQAHFKNKGIKSKDIQEAIKWARQKSS